MEGQFTYTQLSTVRTGCFRILKLQPGDKEAPIVCNLIHAQLDVRPRWQRRWRLTTRKPAYEAISYVWGSRERPVPINCDGRRLYITENLKDALVRVRLTDRSRSVWADSICIDQDNLDEKGHQVQLMGKIYSNASRVLLCLGEDDEGQAQKAMSLVKDVSDMIAKTLPECEQTYGSFPWLAPDDPLLHDDRWPAYSSLLSRPWFRRGWVLQEAALAQDAVVLWGEAKCSWISLMDTEVWVEGRGQILHNQLKSHPFIHRFLHQNIGAHSVRLRPLIWAHKDSGDLHVPYFMATTHVLMLSNPVDRVFAFLGIIDKFTQIELNIKADYSKTSQSVYTEFAIAYLQATGDLSLLQGVQHTNESLERGTPSWVPLWDISEWSSIQDTILATQQDSLVHFTLRQGSSIPKLTVQALLFDTIRFASAALRIETVEDVAQLWQTILEMDKSAGVYDFLQVLCCELCSGEPEVWNLQFSAYGQHLLASSSPNFEGNAEFPLVHSCIRAYTIGRRFVLTDKKGYYGIVPAVAKESDICAFLRGAWPTFCLRQTKNVEQEYKVLGDAYFLNGDIEYVENDVSFHRTLDITALTAQRNFEEHAITLV